RPARGCQPGTGLFARAVPLRGEGNGPSDRSRCLDRNSLISYLPPSTRNVANGRNGPGRKTSGGVRLLVLAGAGAAPNRGVGSGSRVGLGRGFSEEVRRRWPESGCFCCSETGRSVDT